MIHLPSWLTSSQSIAIVGFGKEGQSTYRFLRKYFPHKKIRILDENRALYLDNDNAPMDADLLRKLRHDSKVEQIVGEDAFSNIGVQDVLFKSPGIAQNKLLVEEETYLTSQADLFVQLFGSQTIGVTGTKGKSTTSYAIDHVLRENGKPSMLVGNIGTPVLDIADRVKQDSVIVFEMSSFQTESLHSAPHIGVFTSLYTDHMDYYASVDEYKQAKRHLFDLQTKDDICIYRDDYPEIVRLLATCKAKKITYNAESAKEINLPVPAHVRINYVPSLLIAAMYGVSKEQALSSLTTLRPLPGRLELVGTHRHIAFYDDALATIPEATIAALDSVPNVKTLLVGGYDRKQNYRKLAEKIASSSVDTLILFPTTGQEVGRLTQEIRPEIRCIPANSMEDAVRAAYTYTPEGSSVLLSTASPSFGLFADYKDRSEQYRLCIEKFSHE